MPFGSRFLEFLGPREPPKPTRQQGVPGFVVLGGFLSQNERNPKLAAGQRWITAADLLTNISIIAASVRYMLNLIARPAWRFDPVDESAPAKEAAEFAQSVLDDVRGSWTGTVRRMALYRFHGFGIHEWVAKKRDDGKIGIEAIYVRPCHTINRWDMNETGEVLGVQQRRPQDGTEVYLPRGKVIYLVDDSLTDSPEGMGWFRHLVEPAERLKQLLSIEVMGFERDLSGIPVGRAPIAEINSLVGQSINGKVFKQADADAMIEGIKRFVTAEVRKPNTGLLMDSETYVANTDTGENISSQYKWDVELLTGEQSSIDAMAKAVERLEYSMSLVMGTESMLVGRGGEGSRALSEDKSRNLYLQAESTLEDMCEFVKRDLLGPVWALNGLDDALMPMPKTESVAFKDAEKIAKVLAELSTAGAVLAPDDPAIDDLRSLLDLPPMPKLTEEERSLLMGTALPTPPLDPNKPVDEPPTGQPGNKPKPGEKPPKKGKPPKGGAPPNPKGGQGRAAKYDPAQPRAPAGSSGGGRWVSNPLTMADGLRPRDIVLERRAMRDAEQDVGHYASEANLDPTELVSTQPSLRPDDVTYYREQVRSSRTLDALEVSRIKGQLHIDDGNHRAAAAMQEGVKVPVRIVDLDQAAADRNK